MNWKAILKKITTIPPHILMVLILEKLSISIYAYIIRIRLIYQRKKYWKNPYKLLKLKGHSEFYISEKFKQSYSFFSSRQENSDLINILNSQFPEWVKTTINRADKVCRHELSIFGVNYSLGSDINWHKDYVSGHVWPLKYHRKLKIINLDDDSDVKYAWELNRFYQGIYLGKAYVLTGNEEYASEFFSEFHQWIEKNPPYWGVNWSCAMEVAIRAVNLIWAAFFFKESKYFDAKVKEKFISSMYFHGSYIYQHLEINRRFIDGRYKAINGNHLIADLVGLLYISLVFEELRESKKWFNRAYDGLLNEVLLQVGEDGVHYEYSLNYHRLVLEMILSALILFKKKHIEVPPDVLTRVEKMLEFTNSYGTPNGDTPLIRDIDNGRLHILGEDALVKHGHILPVGAIMFGRADFAHGKVSEDALWFFGSEGYKKYNGLQIKKKEKNSKAFEKSGFYILQKELLQMFVICSAVGMHGFCGHTHNDFLSFELFAYDKSFLTDSGSYVYSRNPELRNEFRSTSYHNTVVIDGKEINEINEHEIFTIGNKVKPKVNLWKSYSDHDLLDAEYSINLEPGAEVTHRRKFYFNKRKNYWVINDFISGSGYRRIETMFHFNENIDLIIQEDIYVKSDCKNGANLMIMPFTNKTIKVGLKQGWVSRIYGDKRERLVAVYSYEGFLPFEVNYVLLPLQCSDNGSVWPDLEGKYADNINSFIPDKKLFKNI